MRRLCVNYVYIIDIVTSIRQQGKVIKIRKGGWRICGDIKRKEKEDGC